MESVLAILSPFDSIRRGFLSVLGPWARTWLVDRERRVAISFVLVVLSSLVLASTSPLLLLALGPIVLGVPHLFSDLRYLVVREGLHKRIAVWAAIFGPLIGLAITADARFGWAAVVGASLVARGSVMRRVAIALIGVGLFALASRYIFGMGLFVAHFHNLFAIFALWIWRPKLLRLSFVPVALFVLASAFVLSGSYVPFLAMTHGGVAPWTGLDLGDQAYTFAPDNAGVLGVHLVVFYAFAQSVHYGLWLRLIPEEARRSKTPRSFKQSARALVSDLGIPIVALAVLLAIGLAVWAAIDLVIARNTYFRFAMFHGYLELAAFALFFCEGSTRRVPNARPQAEAASLLANPSDELGIAARSNEAPLQAYESDRAA